MSNNVAGEDAGAGGIGDFCRNNVTIKGDKAYAYTSQQAPSIPQGLLELCGPDCRSLDLAFNELTSIRPAKRLPRLEELILDNNYLRDLRSLPELACLKTLCVNNNKIQNIESALEKISARCPSIRYVSLLGNPGCPDQLTLPLRGPEGGPEDDDYERYRLYAIHVLPDTLRFLDYREVGQRERLLAKTRGRFLKTIRLDGSAADNNNNNNNNGLSSAEAHRDDHALFFGDEHELRYTPLPATTRSALDHRGAFGKCRYRYSGKNSEGNRFISNSDL